MVVVGVTVVAVVDVAVWWVTVVAVGTELEVVEATVVVVGSLVVLDAEGCRESRCRPAGRGTRRPGMRR